MRVSKGSVKHISNYKRPMWEKILLIIVILLAMTIIEIATLSIIIWADQSP